MAVVRLGGGNSFAIYWLKLVNLGKIRFWWKFRVDFIEIDVALKLVIMVFVLSCRFLNRV